MRSNANREIFARDRARAAAACEAIAACSVSHTAQRSSSSDAGTHKNTEIACCR